MGKFSVRARGSEGEKAAKHNSLLRTKVVLSFMDFRAIWWKG